MVEYVAIIIPTIMLLTKYLYVNNSILNKQQSIKIFYIKIKNDNFFSYA